MRKAAVILGLLLCPLSLAAASGPEGQQVPTAEEFLASLGSAVTMPEPGYANHCSATWQCPIGGFSISCTGHANCTAQPNYVECDGVRQTCPICYVEIDCCGNGDIESCYGYSSCSKAFRSVTCDGVTYRCGPVIERCGA
jgi:hypothetical protein